jgi:hypothetical protein
MANEDIFSGLKVGDLASFIAGPSAATILSDSQLTSRASSYLVGGPVQESICESRTKRERRWKSGSTENWSHGARPHPC